MTAEELAQRTVPCAPDGVTTILSSTRTMPCCGRRCRFADTEPCRRRCPTCRLVYDVTFVPATGASGITGGDVVRAVWERT